jgi:hypothetical protein
MSHDADDSPAHLDTLFTDSQWHEFHVEDKKAGTAVVALMLCIFCIGVVLYTIVAALIVAS